MKTYNYTCTGKKAYWPEGNYQIGPEREGSRRIAIWNNRAWAASGFKSTKQALASLMSEFENVTIT